MRILQRLLDVVALFAQTDRPTGDVRSDPSLEKVLETNGRTGRIKFAITGSSVLALAIHTFFRSYRFDLTGSVLLFLAALPWLITLLLSEELHFFAT